MPRPLRIHDRVRVRLHTDRSCEEVPHFSGEHGRTGRVLRDQPIASAPSHPYLVILDSIGPVDVDAFRVRHFAADELELLDNP